MSTFKEILIPPPHFRNAESVRYGRLEEATRSLFLVKVNEDSVLSVKHRAINLLKTKRRLLYLKTQLVQRSKHFSSRL
jgi:hypothetical protein